MENFSRIFDQLMSLLFLLTNWNLVPEKFWFPSIKQFWSHHPGGFPIEEELSLYLIHGWLHLVGFDDIDSVDRKIIRLEEQRAMDLITWNRMHGPIFCSLALPKSSSEKKVSKQKHIKKRRKFRNAFLTGLVIFLPLEHHHIRSQLSSRSV